MRHLLLYLLAAGASAHAAESQLAVINAVLSSSEDGPPVASGSRFSSGDYLYCTFQIAGFEAQSDEKAEVRKVALSWQAVPEDSLGRPLTEPVAGDVVETLGKEDKNWVPIRRASFLLPPYVAAGEYHLHLTAKDAIAKTDTVRDIPFQMGGVQVAATSTLSIEDFRFYRRENDASPLDLAAYSPGDTVYARFEMTGFTFDSGKHCHVSYSVTVLDPKGKPFIHDPDAAKLDEGGFYPPAYVPGSLALQMGKSNEPGSYKIIVVAKDDLSKATNRLEKTFSIE